MITYILVGLVIALAVFAGIVAKQPDEFRVSRSASMTAGPHKIFLQVNDLHNWNAWSPWAKLDPNARTAFDGSAAGVGAIMRWNGNNKIGSGSMTITESRTNDLVKFRLDFLKPMVATNTAEFTFAPQGSQTLVIWSMQGKNNFIGKTMGLIMNCEKMIGGNFDKGLASLKTIVEAKS